eukprot:266596-Rhodomonas_salina.1
MRVAAAVVVVGSRNVAGGVRVQHCHLRHTPRSQHTHTPPPRFQHTHTPPSQHTHTAPSQCMLSVHSAHELLARFQHAVSVYAHSARYKCLGLSARPQLGARLVGAESQSYRVDICRRKRCRVTWRIGLGAWGIGHKAYGIRRRA